ncbi:MAG: hypothetical protein HYS13_00320 [Planctomycetia bacterium]|nr:hypothetical protein [Planctomycetia bacterium]
MTSHTSSPSVPSAVPSSLPSQSQSPPAALSPALDVAPLQPEELEAVRQLISKAGGIAAARELIEAVQSLQKAA